MRLSTHRLLQVWSLLDTVQSKARIAGRAAARAGRIGNDGARVYFENQRLRCTRIANACQRRLERSG